MLCSWALFLATAQGWRCRHDAAQNRPRGRFCCRASVQSGMEEGEVYYVRPLDTQSIPERKKSIAFRGTDADGSGASAGTLATSDGQARRCLDLDCHPIAGTKISRLLVNYDTGFSRSVGGVSSKHAGA